MSPARLFAALGVVGLGLACGGEPEAPAPAPPPKPRAPAPAVAAASADGGVVDQGQYIYVYNPVGKRDPFRNPVAEPKGAKGDDPGGGGVICDEPLCTFDIEQLALVAVVSGDANPVAMLEDPTRVGHIVRRNTKVGKQGGKVTQILRDCVVVTEFFLTPDGKKNPNKVNICVKKEEAQERIFDLLNNKLQE